MSEPLKPCKDYKQQLVWEILDWQADLQLSIDNMDRLMEMPIARLQEMLAFYKDTLKNGKRL